LEQLQRAICGAKNFFKADIYLKWWNYFLATVKDQSNVIFPNATGVGFYVKKRRRLCISDNFMMTRSYFLAEILAKRFKIGFYKDSIIPEFKQYFNMIGLVCYV